MSSKIASDIKDYSETLPTLKSLTALLATVLTTTATLLGIFNYFVPIQTILPKDPIFIFFFGGFILFVVMIAVIPMTRAFVFKRLLFKNKQSQELHPFFFEEKKAKKLYNSSVYEVEDKLFESLGNREKPKEIPIDVILNITAYASGLAVSFIYWVLVVFFEPLEPFNNPFSILYLIVFPAISSFAIVANISHYKNRVKARLV